MTHPPDTGDPISAKGEIIITNAFHEFETI